MPQGRRKVPFSAKQKKLQLQNKRKRKANVDGKFIQVEILLRFSSLLFILHLTPGDSHGDENVKKINEQPVKSGTRSNVNRYLLIRASFDCFSDGFTSLIF